jgi:putative ABC transport system permease protein
VLALPPRYDDPAAEWLSLIARPRDDVSSTAVEHDVLAIAATVDGAPRPAGDARRVSYERFVDRHPEVRQIARAGVVALLLVALVLLIACFNVAGLVLARSAERRRELSVRAALGASRWRLARELLTEGLVLAMAAGIVAVLVANWSAALLSIFSLPAPIPQRLHFVMDWRLIAFAVCAVVVAAVLPAIAPLLQVIRADLARALGAFGTSGAGGFAQRRTRRAFIVVQVAGSTFLLAATLIFARHFLRELHVDPGFDADHLAILEIDPAQYGHSVASARELTAQVLAAVSNLPAVNAAGAANRVAFYVGYPETRSISVDGRDCAGGGCTQAGRYAVDGGYFDAMGIALVAGRSFRGNGADEPDAAIISQTTATMLWPNATPLGQAFKVEPDGQWLRVIGVAPDVKHRGLQETARPYIYQPLARHATGRVTILARTNGDPAALLLPMRQAMHGIDPRVPPQSVQTMAQRMELPLWQARSTARFVGACGAVAIVLSAIGLFGVTWFTVHQRRREFGVRMAIGASGGRVQRQVVVEALRLSAPGIIGGLAIAVGAAFWIRAAFVGVEAGDALPYVAAGCGQALMCAVASWTPARRASRTDPLEVLRAE